MKQVLIILMLTLCSGCTNTTKYVRGEYGFGFPFAIGHVVNSIHTGTKDDGTYRSNLPMDGHYTSIKIGVRKQIADNWSLGAAIGPAIFFPTDIPVKQEFFSVDVVPRLTYTKWWIQPYGELLGGIGWTDHYKWAQQGTRWNFSIGGGVGAAIPLDKHWEIDIGYRMYHISNGSQVFGSPGPNVGYNTDIIGIGLQYNF